MVKSNHGGFFNKAQRMTNAGFMHENAVSGMSPSNRAKAIHGYKTTGSSGGKIDKRKYLEPDIFNAAMDDDVAEFRRALKKGQSLNDQHPKTKRTPIQTAILNKSLKFLEECLTLEFNPWIVDKAGRNAADYAWAEYLEDIHATLLQKMYPDRSQEVDDIAPPTV